MKIIVLLRSSGLQRILSRIRDRFLRRKAPVVSTAPPGVPPTPLTSGPTAEPGAEVSHTPSPRSERTLVIGVDFGTNSTKVIWQDLSNNNFEVFRWRPVTKRLVSMLLPSTVTLRDGLIHFGISEPDVRDGDVWLHSIKLCVLCRRKPSICRCGNPLARDGTIRLPGVIDAMPASSFACLFLAYVFREVESGLISQFPDDDLLLIWNIGCPMDHLDVTDRRTEWERMAGTAMELRGKASNPADSTLLAEATQLMENIIVGPPSIRNYFVQPEGLAAVKAFLESPHAELKTYAIVDVGAGTTEVSFFFNGRIMSEPGHPHRPSYLADSTEAVGGGKIDLELAQAWNCSAIEARRRKELGHDPIPMVSTIGEICIQYERTCTEILRQQRLMSPHDKRFDLFVIGGGGRLRLLQGALQHRRLPGGFVREGWRQLGPPKSLKNRADIETDYDFLANACGLASSLDWEYFPPRDVPPMAQLPTRPKPDVEEYYPK